MERSKNDVFAAAVFIHCCYYVCVAFLLFFTWTTTAATTEIDYENEIVFLYFLISSSLAYFMQKMEKTTTSGCPYIGDRAKHFHNPQLSIYAFCKKGAQNQHVNHLLDDYCSARGKSANGTRYLNWHLLSAIQLRNSFPNWQND